MKWTDINEITLALCDRHPEVEPGSVRFTQLHQWVLALEEFNDDPARCNERILEAIQQAWLEEVA